MTRKQRILLNLVAGIMLAIALYLNLFVKEKKVDNSNSSPGSSFSSAQ